MPIYEYTCNACQKHFEFFARTLASKPEECPHCHALAEHLTKGFSTFQASSSNDAGCAHASQCSHAHGGGCGCGCCG